MRGASPFLPLVKGAGGILGSLPSAEKLNQKPESSDYGGILNASQFLKSVPFGPGGFLSRQQLPRNSIKNH